MNAISILIPIFNVENYIEKCLDSIASQSFKDYEVIIVNDGSTDNSLDIINKYEPLKDKIKVYSINHNGISEALNMGITKCSGKYIARMDADDIMLPDRLERQYMFMEQHYHYDVLCGGVYEFSDNIEESTPRGTSGELILESFKDSNAVWHPTVMFRSSTIKKCPVLYEGSFNGAEDLKLWCNLLTRGYRIYSDPKPVIYHKTQLDPNTLTASTYLTQAIIRMYSTYNPKLTAIIPFMNEGSEVERTVANIRLTSNINIILIDDASTDGYDYQEIAKIYNCKYYRNSHRLGVAGSRNKGVQLCETEFFVLLDAHMRFGSLHWQAPMITLLSENPKRLICTNSAVITKTEYGGYEGEVSCFQQVSKAAGAAVNKNFHAYWTYKSATEDSIIKVPCVIGAVYASSKTWWNIIGGLEGLTEFGDDEPLMSIKTWLSGGEVLLLKDLKVGHVYRDENNKMPYKNSAESSNLNSIFLKYLFTKDASINDIIRSIEESIKEHKEDEKFCAIINNCLEYIRRNSRKIISLKEKFWKYSAKYPIEFFWNINDLVKDGGDPNMAINHAQLRTNN